MDVETIVRKYNSSVVEHVHSINAVTNGRRLNSILERESGDLKLNKCLSIDRIPGAIGITDELTRPTYRTKLITLPSTDRYRWISERSKDVLRNIRNAVKQY